MGAQFFHGIQCAGNRHQMLRTRSCRAGLATRRLSSTCRYSTFRFHNDAVQCCGQKRAMSYNRGFHPLFKSTAVINIQFIELYNHQYSNVTADTASQSS